MRHAALILATLLTASPALAWAQAGEWVYSETADPFTDRVSRSALILSPTHRASMGDTIALFVGCDSDDRMYAGLIWEDVLQDVNGQGALQYRVTGNEAQSVPVAIGGPQDSHSSLQQAADVRSMITAMRDAEANSSDARILFGIEAYNRGKRLAEFPLDGFTSAVAPISDCHF